MIRKFAAVTALSLALGGIQAASADSVFLYQGPPRLEFGDITFSSDSSAVTNLQPSKGDSRTWHSVDVSVVTNGAISTIDRVTLCLYKDSEHTDDDGDGDAEELCGYEGGTGAAPTDPDPKHVISMKFEGDPSSLSGDSSEWSIDGTNSHDIQSTDTDVTTTTTSDYGDGSGTTLTLNKATFTFEFAVSHAAANADDWKIRVSTKTTSPGPDGNPEGGDDVTEGAVASSFTDSNSNASKTTYGMFFFAAFDSTVRGQVDYGNVAEQSSVSVTDINTAQYWANDVVDISLLGTNFTYDDASNGVGVDDTVNLITESPGSQKAVQVVCDVASSESGTSAPLNVPNESTFADGANILLTGEPATGESSVAAKKHDCTLYYGSGATFGNAVYSNTMTVGLLDGDITDSITAGDFGSSSPAINPAP